MATLTKVVVDCSGADGLASTVPAILQQAAEAALAGDAETTAELIALAQQRTNDAAALPDVITTVELTENELAQLAIDQQATATQVVGERQVQLQQLRAKRDRWLAETDVLMLPAASMPTDAPNTITQAMSDPANQKTWAAFRAALRAMFDNVTDPADVVWPVQPAAPAMLLS